MTTVDPGSIEKKPDLESYLDWWQHNPENNDNIAASEQIQFNHGSFSSFPCFIDPSLIKALHELGIDQLYSHQSEAILELVEGRNVVISTGTASGKTLCYTIPIINTLIESAESRTLLVYPTKALTYDQHQILSTLLMKTVDHCSSLKNTYEKFFDSVYDGDTPGSARSGIRETCHILSTNPDMLHIGILPHHDLWSNFLSRLRFVVIDEIHLYRGVFGSHVANVIRRLQRICNYYGAFPQFILTSATIANAQELAEGLIEQPCSWINKDGSPHGKKYFILYNPPFIDTDLGIRKSCMGESIRIGTEFFTNDIQTIMFARTRRMVELIVRQMKQANPDRREAIGSYRSGYLPRERRKIEGELRAGRIKIVATTNALELGIDIGGMDGIILVGYPGTIASTRQQAGRAGRRLEASIAVLVASPNPLDQYIALHPEFLLAGNPEKAFINPDNLLILLEHLRCAAFELPFNKPYRFGKVKENDLVEFLNALVQMGEVYEKNGRYFWVADKYPSGKLSLRSAGSETVLLETVNADERNETLGKVDRPSSYWMVHPGAIYLHQGRTYQVEHYDLERSIARLSAIECDYYTAPQQKTEIELEQLQKEENILGGMKNLGEIMVSSQVTGYKNISWETGEVLDYHDLDMPVSELHTVGYWISFNEQTVQKLRDERNWTVEKNNYGKEWNSTRKLIRQRDQFTCQACGRLEQNTEHHVHHKIPFKCFTDQKAANSPSNLVTLCPACHQKAEINIYVRSGLTGLVYLLHNLTPIFTMCDVKDIGAQADPEAKFANGSPSLIFYDQVPAGIGLCQSLFDVHYNILDAAHEILSTCKCADGCPNCVGPTSMVALGGKNEARAILHLMIKN